MFASIKKIRCRLDSNLVHVNELRAYLSLYGRRIGDLFDWASMTLYIASVFDLNATVVELKVTRLKKPIAIFSSLHVFASILQKNEVKFDGYNDSIACPLQICLRR